MCKAHGVPPYGHRVCVSWFYLEEFVYYNLSMLDYCLGV